MFLFENFLVLVYPVEIAFTKSCPRIVVEVKEADSSRTVADPTTSKQTKQSEHIETRQITEAEKEKLTAGM